MTYTHARRGRALLFACTAFTALGTMTSAAQAATTPSFSCTANAVTVQLAGGSIINPITAGGDGKPCQAGVAGLSNTGEAAGAESLTTARTAYAATDPGGATPSTSKPAAQAGIEGLDVVLGGSPLGVSAARSSITGSCAGGNATLVPRSEVASITLAGTPIVLDGVVQPITDALTGAVGAVVEVKLNEVVDLKGGGKAVRAAHVTLLQGATPVADVIIAESRLDLNGAACSAATSDNGGGATPPSVCPTGSVYDASHNVCVITGPSGNTTGTGSIIIGPPSSGPSGGEVLSLVAARKRYHSRCLRGRGPRYVVVGGRHRDRITGTNRRDRILGRGGSDRIDGGRNRDCIDGGRGKDFVTGGQGRDRMFGGRARDIVNGDGRSDLLVGGRGNDTINAGYGADRVRGGRGNDKINVATAGRKATVHAGKGRRDKVRCNPRELRRIHGAEIIKVTRPYKG